MNHEESLKFLEEQCTCCICLNRYEDPARLPCGHSCCRSCLEEILKLERKRTQSSITCPICRKICFLRGRLSLCTLPVDNELTEKLGILHAIEPENKAKFSEKCQVCAIFPKRGAEFRCLSCDVFICSSCLQGNNSHGAAHIAHHIAGLRKAEEGKSILHCKDHKFYFRYFCRNCDHLVCSECCLKGHNSHEIYPVKEAKNFVKNQLQAIYDSVKQKASVTESSVLKCKESIQKFENEGVKLRNDLRKEKKKILSQMLFILNNVETNYMKVFDNQVEYFKNVIKGKLDEAQLKHTTVQSWKDALEETLNMKNDTDFLAKAEHVKKHANEVNSLSADIDDDNRVHNLFHVTEILNPGLPDSVYDEMFSSLGNLQIKGSRDKKKWRKYTCEIDDDVINEAKRQDGSNLSRQILETEPVVPTGAAQAGLKADSKAVVSEPSASTSVSNTASHASFAHALQSSAAKTSTVTTVNVPSVFVGMNVVSQVGNQIAQVNRSHSLSNNSSSCVNIRATANGFSAVGTASNQGGQRVSASVFDVRSSNNNPRQGFGTPGSGNQNTGWREVRSMNRGAGAQNFLQDSSDSDFDSSSSVVYCHRCNRHNHTYLNCHAKRNSDGQWIRGIDQNKCYRCGRRNHKAPECYAWFDVDGDRL